MNGTVGSIFCMESRVIVCKAIDCNHIFRRIYFLFFGFRLFLRQSGFCILLLCRFGLLYLR